MCHKTGSRSFRFDDATGVSSMTKPELINLNELDVLSSNRVKIIPLNTKLHGVVNSSIGNSVYALLYILSTVIAFTYFKTHCSYFALFTAIISNVCQ